jgi:hypothetical protein
MIEDHAAQLTLGVIDHLQANPRTEAYHKLSRDELHRRVYEVYHHHLGAWLVHKTDEAIEARYRELATTRQQESIPLHEVVYALILTKYHLRDYIRSAGFIDSCVELYQEQELQRLIGQFFDKAIYDTVKGYQPLEDSEPTPVTTARQR